VEPLEDRIGAAIERLSNARRVLLQRAATTEGMSLLQCEALLRIASTSTPVNRAARLADELGVTTATIADSIAALVRKGLVTQRVDHVDGRRKTLHLTEKGDAVALRLRASESALGEPLSESSLHDQAVTLSVLLDLIAALYRTGVITVDRSCRTCRHFRTGSDGQPAHCTLLDLPLPPDALRSRCPDHLARR
jgi:DNA-binding MarR family transcriptional regulator